MRRNPETRADALTIPFEFERPDGKTPLTAALDTSAKRALPPGTPAIAISERNTGQMIVFRP